MTLKRKLGTDSKSINNGAKASRALNVETKKKVLTKNEVMLECKALEKKYEELIIEKDNLLKKNCSNGKSRQKYSNNCRTRKSNQA